MRAAGCAASMSAAASVHSSATNQVDYILHLIFLITLLLLALDRCFVFKIVS